MDAIKTNVRKRAATKGKITKSFNNYQDPQEGAELLSSNTLKSFINDRLVEIEKFDELISNLYYAEIDKLNDDDEIEEFQSEIDIELDAQTDYALSVKSRLDKICDAKSATNCTLKLPELHCDTFTGEGSSNLEYHAFMSKFNNVVGLRANLSDSTKFTYLRTYLKGYALKLVQHLQVTDSNYKEALKLLEVEFLNTNALVDDLFRKLLDLKPKFDGNYLGTKLFISEIRCILSDLKIYKCDLLSKKSSLAFLSHIVFNKLPYVFKQELARKCDDNYPSLDDIFDNYVEVIKTLMIRQSNPYVKPTGKSDHSQQNANNSSKSNSSVKQLSITNNKTSSEPRKNCKFCSSTGHSMMKCTKFPTFESRVSRCNALKMCTRCSSFKHKESDCNSTLDYECATCKTKDHISAMCSKLVPVQSHSCITMSHSGGRTFMLPTVSVRLSHGNYSTSVLCLIDTGSQRSYVSGDVLKHFNITENIEKNKCMISTFIDNNYKTLSELCFSFDVNGNGGTLPFYIDYDFKLNYTIDGLGNAYNNIAKQHTLSDHATNDYVQLGGLLGVDALQFLPQLNIVKCLGGSAFEMENGSVIPFGNVDNFLSHKELLSKYSQNVSDTDKEEPYINSITQCVFNPVQTCFDPIASVVQESSVEGKLDRLFDLDSLGIRQEQSDYDLKQIEEFDSAISLDNGHYYVNIPWNDKIDQVKTNYGVCKSILIKVHNNLIDNNLYDQYNSVFEQQLADGIIEEVPIDPSQNKHVYIPHRPVIKIADNISTKTRIVLNCSLKIGESPSLNEACYPGINLLNDLFSLLLKTRADDYIMISDVKQAFLMIKLKREEDKDRFRVLWINSKNKLVSYRYTTIVFGHIASPFILNHVMNHHLTHYEKDECHDVLSNNKYVDNIFATGNNPLELNKLCDESRSRLSDGGFELRSWASNSTHLQDKFNDDGISSRNDVEKLLGYVYSPSSDKINLPCLEYKYDDNEPLTKRKILSCTAAVFDPFGFHNPVAVRGKILLQKVWAAKYGWDEPLPLEIVNEFKTLLADLGQLHTLSFPRKAYGENISLIFFTDASNLNYGFSCYTRCIVDGNVETNLLFSKCKTAPTKSKKSVPTLELLAVYLALKCLPAVLDSLSQKTVTDIFIGVDAQVVISWVLTKNVKAKNIFASNRVKDISGFRDEILEKYGHECKFKYVPTDLNVADLVTKGISFKMFKSKIDFWQHGPQFLSEPVLEWPERSLGCLSEASKALTCNVTVHIEPELLDIKSYSNINKLFRVTMLVFKFINRLKKQKTDRNVLMEQAKIYLFKKEQVNYFNSDFEYLQNVGGPNIPSRVNNLNLFIDENGLLRSKGRLSKCSSVDYNVNNPILLSKDSYLTQLVIWDFHARCKHLGSGTTLTALRNGGFWIPKGRNIVKYVLNKCIMCKKFNAHAFKYPRPNDYPREKVSFKTPYQFTGMDFTGHVFVKLGNGTVKMYILVFTCLNIRSVHLELVPSMTMTHFLQAFIRFCNLYGLPQTVFSDNASTFISSLKLISKSKVDNDFENYLLTNNIKHVTIPVYSAWIGSSWERMIRTIKSSLHKVLGRKHVEYFEMLTLLSDVQNAINSRPLCYHDNDDQNYTIITPNTFLKFETGRSMVLGSAASEVTHANSKQLIDAMLRREAMYDNFRELWFHEYLTSLREIGRDLYQTDWINSVKTGDIVLIFNPTKPRTDWNLGRVTELLPGNDGKVRTVKVMRSDRSEAVYSIKLLYPLELSVTPTISNEDPIESPGNAPFSPRPKRAAAMRCLQRLKCN